MYQWIAETRKQHTRQMGRGKEKRTLLPQGQVDKVHVVGPTDSYVLDVNKRTWIKDGKPFEATYPLPFPLVDGGVLEFTRQGKGAVKWGLK